MPRLSFAELDPQRSQLEPASSGLDEVDQGKTGGSLLAATAAGLPGADSQRASLSVPALHFVFVKRALVPLRPALAPARLTKLLASASASGNPCPGSATGRFSPVSASSVFRALGRRE